MPADFTHQQAVKILRIAPKYIHFENKLLFKISANKNALDALQNFCVQINWSQPEHICTTTLQQFIAEYNLSATHPITELEWVDLCKKIVGQYECLFDRNFLHDFAAFDCFSQEFTGLLRIYDPAKSENNIKTAKIFEQYWLQFMGRLCQSPTSHTGEILHSLLYLGHKISSHSATTCMNISEVSPPIVGCFIEGFNLTAPLFESDFTLDIKNEKTQAIKNLTTVMSLGVKQLLTLSIVQQPFNRFAYTQLLKPSNAFDKHLASIQDRVWSIQLSNPSTDPVPASRLLSSPPELQRNASKKTLPRSPSNIYDSQPPTLILSDIGNLKVTRANSPAYPNRVTPRGTTQQSSRTNFPPPNKDLIKAKEGSENDSTPPPKFPKPNLTKQ